MKRAAASLLILTGACTTRAAPAEDLPPMDDVAAMSRIYAARLDRLRLRIVQAARYEEVLDTRHIEPSPTGTHLALCLEHRGPRTISRYVRTIAPSLRIFRDVLQRWPGLTSFDVCQQEPAPAKPPPWPLSHIRLDRARAASLDWDRLDLPTIIRAAEADPPEMVVYLSPEVLRSSIYEAAYRAAREEVASPNP